MPVTKEIKFPEGSLRVPIKDIVVESERGRKDFTKLPELMDSIERLGLQQPLVINKKDGKLLLKAGERRLRSLTALGCVEAPIVFWNDLDSVAQKEIELEENLCREALSWTEQCELMLQIDELKKKIHGESKFVGEAGWSIQKTADLVGESKGKVSEKTAIAKLYRTRPDIKAKTSHLPMAAAARAAKQLLETEEVKAKIDRGVLNLDTHLLLGDSRNLIKDIPSNSVSLLLTDPPFGISEIDDNVGKSRGSTQSYLGSLKRTDNLSQADVIALFGTLVPEFFRVLKPGSYFYIFFAADMYQPLSGMMSSVGFVVDPVPLIWDKGRTTTQWTGYNYQSTYEPILFGYKPPRLRRLTSGSSNIIRYSPVTVQNKNHPFEKPQELLRFLIKQSTTLAETVLDPFAGSASCLSACKSCGRKGLGFELDESRFMIAQGLLTGEIKQEVLTESSEKEL